MFVNNPCVQSESQTPSAQRPVEPELFRMSHQIHRSQSTIDEDKESYMNAEPDSPFIGGSLLSRLVS